MSGDRLAHLRKMARPIAVGRAGARSGQQLCAHAEALRKQLVPLAAAVVDRQTPGQLLVLCNDRYHFAVALLGAWQAGLAVAVPSSRAPAALAQLAAAPGVVASVADHDLESDMSPLLDLRTLEVDQDEVGGPWDPQSSELAATLYTSGSTGAPRGIPKRFEQLLQEAQMLSQHFDFADATVLPTVPAHHIYGLLWGVLAPLLAGGCFVRETPLLATEIAQFARATEATMLVAVPAHLQGLTTLDGLPPSLRRVFSSGAPLDAELARRLEQLHRLPIIELLGSTETGGIASRRPAQDAPWRSLPGVSVRADEQQQLWVRSAYTDAGRAVEYRCADRIELSGDGGFVHLGRSDSVVKVGARRLDLDELRDRLRALPRVTEAHVVAIPVDGLRGNEIACVLVAPPDLDRRALRKQLSQWFDPTVLPRRICLVGSAASIARDENGKVRRQTLLDLLAADSPVAFASSTASPIFDRVEELDTQDSIRRVRLRVRPDAWCFGGHFDGQPLLPAVVQLNDLTLLQVRRAWPQLAGLRGARALKFRSPIGPGDVVILGLERVDRDGQATVRFTIERGETLCASGTLIFELA